MQNQSKREITFDNQLKTTLYHYVWFSQVIKELLVNDLQPNKAQRRSTIEYV